MMRMLFALIIALCCAASAAQAQNVMCATQVCATTQHYISAATNNATTVKAAPGAVYAIVADNITTSTFYLKLYDEATTPVCGTDPVLMTIPLPSSATAGQSPVVVIQPSVGLGFNNGIGFCIVHGILDSDNTPITATGATVAISYR